MERLKVFIGEDNCSYPVTGVTFTPKKEAETKEELIATVSYLKEGNEITRAINPRVDSVRLGTGVCGSDGQEIADGDIVRVEKTLDGRTLASPEFYTVTYFAHKFLARSVKTGQHTVFSEWLPQATHSRVVGYAGRVCSKCMASELTCRCSNSYMFR